MKQVPNWLTFTGSLLGVLVTLYGVGVWLNVKIMDDFFLSEAEAGEVQSALVKQIEESGRERKLNDIRLQLEVINVEINWLASLENKTVHHDERLNVLRTQQRILLEQYAQMQ